MGKIFQRYFYIMLNNKKKDNIHKKLILQKPKIIRKLERRGEGMFSMDFDNIPSLLQFNTFLIYCPNNLREILKKKNLPLSFFSFFLFIFWSWVSFFHESHQTKQMIIILVILPAVWTSKMLGRNSNVFLCKILGNRNF